MSTVIQFRRGTGAEADALTGYEGELFLDLTNQTLRYHDGSQQGGFIVGRVANSISGYNIQDAYTKVEVNALIDTKADLGSSLAEYGILNAYTKTEVDNLISSEASYIESTDQTTSVIAGNDGISVTGNIAFTDSTFILADPTNRLTNIYINDEINTSFGALTFSAGTVTFDNSPLITAAEVETLVATEISTAFSTRETLAQYGITDAYTMSAVDYEITTSIAGAIAPLAVATDVYTKVETDNLLGNYYDATTIDTILSSQDNFVDPPATSIGLATDNEGDMAYDGTYFYICVAAYDGVTDIWRRVTWTDSSW